MDEYGFTTALVGLTYLGLGLGLLSAVWFLVPRIDTVYKSLTEKNNDESKPEFRLPLANIGAVLVPVMIFNTVQDFYIDSFEKYAASALAAGALFRSFAGGIVPLLVPRLFDKLGYGWGLSVFGFLALGIAPAPVLFYIFGVRLRKRFQIDL